jgi:hypothetical protein
MRKLNVRPLSCWKELPRLCMWHFNVRSHNNVRYYLYVQQSEISMWNPTTKWDLNVRPYNKVGSQCDISWKCKNSSPKGLGSDLALRTWLAFHRLVINRFRSRHGAVRKLHLWGADVFAQPSGLFKACSHGRLLFCHATSCDKIRSNHICASPVALCRATRHWNHCYFMSPDIARQK